MPKIAPTTRFSLENAPTGMVVQAASGYLHWTPSTLQQGQVTISVVRNTADQSRSDPLTLTVGSGTDPAGPALYLAPDGDDGNAGTLAEPLLSVHEAAARATPGTTLYLRGGRYFNEGYGTAYEGRRNNLARITTSGTAEAPITLRPFGNEYATLVTDVNGIVFKDASHWRVEGLELEGNAQSLDRDDSLALWWDTSDAVNRIQGAGIAMNTSFHIVINGCVIHDFPGGGLSNTTGAYLTLEDSLVYNNAEWSTAGTHGFANSSPQTLDNGDTTSVKIAMRRNLLFGNQSSMISHVFSKGKVTLAVDEGNGLHMQNNGGLFFGRFEVRDNLLLYNGKAGLGLNTVDDGIIANNAFYANAQAVQGSGELSLQDSSSDSIDHNLFHALPSRRTIKDFSGTYEAVGDNYAVKTADDDALPSSVVGVAAVFSNPAGGDFSPAAGIPEGFGPPASVLEGFAARIAEYGLEPAPVTVVDADYVEELRAAILASWPVPGSNPDIPSDLVLFNPLNGYCYAYEDRNDFPGPPHSGATCN